MEQTLDKTLNMSSFNIIYHEQLIAGANVYHKVNLTMKNVRQNKRIVWLAKNGSMERYQFHITTKPDPGALLLLVYDDMFSDNE